MVCCDICNGNDAIYKYILVDQSSICICESCGEIVYGKSFIPCIPNSRLFQIILMMEYIKQAKIAQAQAQQQIQTHLQARVKKLVNNVAYKRQRVG